MFLLITLSAKDYTYHDVIDLHRKSFISFFMCIFELYFSNEHSRGDIDPEPSRGVPRGHAAFERISSNPAQRTLLALWEAHYPLPHFFSTGAAHPILHLRLILLRAGDVEVKPGPVCSGCTGTIRVGSHPIICTQCQRLFHGYCNA